MQLDKPQIQRSYVTITDATTKKRVCLTVYGSTPAELSLLLVKGAKDRAAGSARRRRERQPV